MILSHKIETKDQTLSIWIQVADSLDLEDAAIEDFNVELLTPSGTHDVKQLFDNAGLLHQLISTIDWEVKYLYAKIPLK